MMSDGSAKTLMVDERQTVREVLDTLFEKTHCDCSIDWSLCETNPELQIGEMNTCCTQTQIICRQAHIARASKLLHRGRRHCCTHVSGLKIDTHFQRLVSYHFRERLWGPWIFSGAAVYVDSPQWKQNQFCAKTSEVCDVHRPSGEHANVHGFSSRQSLITQFNA